MKKYIFLITLFSFYNSNSEQFIYPVASCNDENQILLLYQKSLENIELWMWDPVTHKAIKSLSSFFSPVNVRMMPFGKGFSFIDQGYIKIKEFDKRSPKTLPIYESIGLFSHMNWIDEERFSFVARQGDFFQIFQGDLNGNIKRLTSQDADALYPQKINSTLFYIQRDVDYNFSIISSCWNPVAMNNYNDEFDNISIVESRDQLCYLHMIDDSQGFYIQAPTDKIIHDDGIYTFSYHQIKKDNTIWSDKKLFTFTIQAKFLTGSCRLYESLEPFLPQYDNHDAIYFVDWNNTSQEFEILQYSFSDKKINNVAEQIVSRYSNEKIFAAYQHGNKIFTGLIINENDQEKNNVLKQFELDRVVFDFPYLLT